MNNADLLTTDFPVTLPDGTVLTVQKLALTGEQRILQELSRRLFQSFGPGGYFANMKPALDWMQSQGMTAAYSQAVSDLTRLTATKTMPGFEATMEFRQTPEGLACELFLRTRKTHPDLAEQLIRSQLNAATVTDVYEALEAGLSADLKRRPAPAGEVPH
jgi:hypothetical protein